MRAILGVLAMLAGLIPATASATWLRATTAHFVIYDDTTEAKARAEATELERFDTVLRHFHRTEPNPDDAFNKVTIYVVGGTDAISRLTGSDNIVGFYLPRTSGSVAFTPRISGASASDGDMTAQIVLYHEYAHHFLLGNRAAAYPLWFSEGYAEFASTAHQIKDRYWLGSPANHRAYSLIEGPAIPSRTLLNPPERMDGETLSAFYGRGWLLTHYLMFDAGKRAQLSDYLNAFNRGEPGELAATKAFGDLGKLDRALNDYLHQKRLPALSIAPESLGTPTVAVEPLTAGQAAMIALRIRSTAGVDAKTAGPLYAKAAPIAARYASDAQVEGWLAEMALDAGELDAADRAADAAIAADPTQSQGLLYKARVLLARAVKAKSTDTKTWSDARAFILKANKVENNDAAALRLYYDSFGMQGIAPRESAKKALYRAAELVPQDGDTRFVAACQEILDGHEDYARARLRPLAADPHAGHDNSAVRLLAALDAGKHGAAAIDAAQQPDAAKPKGTPAS